MTATIVEPKVLTSDEIIEISRKELERLNKKYIKNKKSYAILKVFDSIYDLLKSIKGEGFDTKSESSSLHACYTTRNMIISIAPSDYDQRTYEECINTMQHEFGHHLTTLSFTFKSLKAFIIQYVMESNQAEFLGMFLDDIANSFALLEDAKIYYADLRNRPDITPIRNYKDWIKWYRQISNGTRIIEFVDNSPIKINKVIRRLFDFKGNKFPKHLGDKP